MKSLIIWVVVLLTIIGSLFAIYKVAKAPTAGNGSGGPIPEISAGDRTKGPKDSKVVLIEYSDFQCPACGAFFPAISDLNKELAGKIFFVYRNFPLPQHKNALAAAYAAEAAGLQGKFWEMHDQIFKNQDEWSESTNAADIFKKYAQTVGLNMDKFISDAASKGVKDKVDSDSIGGVKAGVNSTPTFFLNGEKMTGYRTYDEFKNIVREAVRNNS